MLWGEVGRWGTDGMLQGQLNRLYRIYMDACLVIIVGGNESVKLTCKKGHLED